MKNSYSHYYKTLPCLTVDVYRVLHAFEVTDPCLQHAAKKIMCAGGRGAKDAKKDVEEAIDSLVRWLEMRREESGENLQGNDLKVSICDTMNLADSFLREIRATELAYAENQHKTLWTEADEERMRVVMTNGPTGEHYLYLSDDLQKKIRKEALKRRFGIKGDDNAKPMFLRDTKSHQWLDHEDEEAQA